MLSRYPEYTKASRSLVTPSSSPLWFWVRPFGRFLCGKRTDRRPDSLVNGVVPVEQDVLRLVQRDGHFSKTDGSGFDQSDEEVWDLVICYVDDVVITTATLEDYTDRLEEVFGCMKRSGWKFKPSKCEILRDPIKYLGRMVDRHGVRPYTEEVEVVLTWKAPRTDTQLMSLLGFAN